MEEDIFADIGKEGDPAFPNTEDTPSESQPEKETETVKPAQGDNTEGKDIPFHEHPRWIAREKELEELRASREEDAQRIAELSAITNETSKRLPSDSPIPDWFSELYGDNQVAWTKYSDHDRAQRESIKQEILQEQQKAVTQQQEETAHWNRWVDTEINKLESSGKSFDKNKLIKTMLEYRPTDEQGNFDFEKGYKIYETLEAKDPAVSQARKEIADTATRSTTKETSSKDYQTPASLRNKSWANITD